MANIPRTLLDQLRKIEPNAEFSGSLPKTRSSSGKFYFAKTGSPAETEQYVGEVESLKAMAIGAPGLVPSVLASGVNDDGKPYFISEYKEISSLSDRAATTLAKRLATELHMYKGTNGFGFGVPTFCGATKQPNGWFDSWEKCYTFMMSDLVRQLRQKGRFSEVCNKADLVIKNVIPKLLGPLVIEPVILHGDLWSGNAGVDSSTGEPVIYDPSSYFGHNEADLAIARIFGGFPRSFYSNYHEHHPKSEPVGQYELRADLYELYHYLNHTLLFGSGYSSSAMSKMDRLLSAKL